MPKRILVTAPALSESGTEVLRAAGAEMRLAGSEDDLAALAASFRPDGIISRTRPLPEAVMAAAPSIRVIAKHGAGVDNIDVSAASRHSIAVFSTPGANSLAVAEFTLTLILATARKLVRFDATVRAGDWERAGDGRQISGMTLGLVGYGRIARRVGRMAAALGMRVITHDPFADKGAARSAGVELRDSLDALVAEAEVLSLHCPAEPGRPPLIDRSRLALMPQGAFLVNTARGDLVDEAALADALESGRLGGAGLDTFAIEPLPADSPLRRMRNVVLAPHVAGSTPEALAAMASGAASTILAYLDALDGARPVSEELWARCVNAADVRPLTGALRAAQPDAGTR